MTLELYRPAPEELRYRQMLLADEATMAYNAAWGGVIDFPQEKWQDWYARWMTPDASERFYRYLYDPAQGCFVGEAAYRYAEEYQAHVVSIIVEAKHRGRGCGRAALALLMDAARANGVKVLCDDIAIGNPGVTMFLRMGFTEAWRDERCVMVEKVL